MSDRRYRVITRETGDIDIYRIDGQLREHVASCDCLAHADYLAFILRNIPDDLHQKALKESVARADGRRRKAA